MNAERLLQHYEQIADAPDAIARLRRFILDLAVRGKLVPQDPNDEPASELLKRIAKEKARLVKAGEIRKPPSIEPIKEAELPSALPRTWHWVRIGEIFDYDAGTKRDPKELDQSRWLLELEDIEKDTSRIVERLRVSDRDSQSTKSEFEPGDILYGKLRPYLNKVLVADEAGYSTTEIVAIRPFMRLCPNYCALAFRRPDFVAYVERLGRGTKMPRLRTPDAIVAPFPLPPLAEQHRIVAKVDELMGLCDRLEAARAGREAVRDRLAVASLARLNAPDPEPGADPAKVGTGFASGSATNQKFQADARFALDALPALTTRPDQIKRLRQTILNLAVRGKLVPQDPNDETASELLKRIAKEKARAARTGSSQETQLSGCLEKAIAEWDLPSTWKLVPISDVLLSSFYGPRFGADEYISNGVPTIRTTDMTDDGRIVLRNPPTVSIPNDRLSDFKCLQGDLLVTRTGSIGTMALFDGDYIAVPSAYLIRLRFSKLVDARYLHLLLRSPSGQNALGLGTTRVAQPNINAKTLSAIPVPLPPLAEQHRIVAKVDALMALCDRLEASLIATAATRRRLLDALLAEALAPVDVIEMEAAE